MFTGIVKGTAEITYVEPQGEGLQLKAESSLFEGADKGESISLSGACLTVEKNDGSEIQIFLAEETIEKTWFDTISEGDQLNVERSLKAEDRLSGHIIQGHVEGTAKILEIEELEEGWNITFEKPSELGNYIVNKGYIGVEGISLTVTQITEDSFSVTIIPETWNVTNLSEKEEGDKVNIETDVTGRYVEKMVEKQG
jgi:riboflavin synthase